MGSEGYLCTNVVLTTVEPLEKKAHVEAINPTATDMLTLDSFMPIFFAYRLRDSSDAVYEEAVSRIKVGLQKVLVSFFPWAGRWIAVPGGRGRRLLCNDKGISFIEAYVDQDLDSVVRFSAAFQPVPELQGYGAMGMDPMQFRHPMVPEGHPCAFVQVTRFKCGGLTVALTFSHMLADGTSFMQFMAAWSDFSRTGKTERTMDPNRAAVDTSSQASLPEDSFESAPPALKWEVKCYEVSAPVIQALKKEVKQRGDGSYVSTIDCIFAHLWKTLSSLPLSITGGKEIGMLNSVEGRSKFYDPPLPNLLGNVLVTFRSPRIAPSDVLKMPLSGIASKIREKLINTKRETWLSPERVAESMEVFMDEKLLPWGQTCWNSFPVYEIDFGFGCPFFTPGLNFTFAWDMLGFSYIGAPTPGVASSAAFLVIRSTPEVQEALQHDPEFLPFFLTQK